MLKSKIEMIKGMIAFINYLFIHILIYIHKWQINNETHQLGPFILRYDVLK